MSGDSYTNEGLARGGRRKRHRGWTVLVWVLFSAGVAFWLTAVIAIKRAVPILRDRVVNTLATKFDSRVELADFDVSLASGVDVTGRGLKLFPNALDRDEAAFGVGQFHFHTTPWALLRSPMHVGRVELTDLEIYRPTQEERARMKAEAETRAKPAGKNKVEVVVDEMVVDQARLTLGTDKPGKQPLLFEIHALHMWDVGRSSAMRFHATLVNPKPIGEIDTTGWFGPYVTEEPGESPVRGDYAFHHADLGTIKGIGGTLSSTGRYQGKLSGMTVDGVTDTPDFELDTAHHQMPLRTKFHAVVDGLNGNTYLQPVEATLGSSHIVARGKVERAHKRGARAGETGRHVELQVEVGPHADIADMLRLAAKTAPPVMHGRLRLVTGFDLPAAEGSVTQRMRLKGRFEIDGAVFTNSKVQGRVDSLSLRAQGRPGEVKHAAAEAPIESEMEGQFALSGARLTLTGLTYRVPGAEIAVDGVYTLDGRVFDFTGKARMQAHVSQMVTGWKGWLLKPLDPLLAKHGAGTEVPFTVTGTEGEPKIGVAWFGGKEKEQ